MCPNTQVNDTCTCVHYGDMFNVYVYVVHVQYMLLCRHCASRCTCMLLYIKLGVACQTSDAYSLLIRANKLETAAV